MQTRFKVIAAGGILGAAALTAAIMVPAQANDTQAAAAPGAQNTVTQEDGVSTQSWAQCPAGYLCVWTGANGTGRFAKFRSNDTSLRGTGLNNAITSAMNRTGRQWRLYDGVGYKGTAWTVQPQKAYPDFYASADNKASSLRRL